MKKAERIYTGHLNIDTSKPISVEEFKKIQKGITEPKRSKFGAKQTIVDEIRFDSIKESKRYVELKMLHGLKMISKPILQYEFELTAGIKYRCDFFYFDYETKTFVVEDTKGFKTPEYKMKKKLMNGLLGIEIKES